MRVKKLTGAAMFVIAATGIVAGTAHAESESSRHPTIVRGAIGDVGYEVIKSDDGKSLAANLFGGTFRVTDTALTVTDRAGNPVAAVPLTVELANRKVDIRPQVDQTGTRLTAEPIGVWHMTSPRERSMWTGAAVGAFAGAIIGIIAGLVVFSVITMPVGALIGGAIGAGIGAAVPNSDVPDRWDYNEPSPPPALSPSPFPKPDPDCSWNPHQMFC